MSAEDELISPRDSEREEESEEQEAEAHEGAEGGSGERRDNDAGGSWVLLEGAYRGDVVNDEIFEELRVCPEAIREGVAAWEAYIRAAESPEAAGEALYAAIYDAAPNLQSMYKTPRAIMGMRYVRAFSGVFANLHDPRALKASIEALSFAHLGREVTAPRVAIFRDAVVDTIIAEVGAQCTSTGAETLRVVMNYIGGAFLYVRTNYGGRLKILSSSWAIANKRPVEAEAADRGEEARTDEAHDGAEEQGSRRAKRPSAETKDAGAGSRLHSAERGREHERDNIAVPTTFPEMFRFNAAVMGFAENDWMGEVLFAFDAVVRNVANSIRFQEECDVLSLRLSKCRGPIDLSEFKAVMLASLRSLVPKAWDSDHEVAWGWMWQNMERMISAQIGKPGRQERAISAFFSKHDDKGALCSQVYTQLFQQAPACQAYFKQSATRLQFVSERVLSMTTELYKEPRALVDELSACGLRHVGYGVLPELCAPFVCAYVSVVRQFSDNPEVSEAFEWSLGLISRIIARVINEGSTMVMRAINANSGKQLSKAVACAPRSERAAWVLSVTAGSQSISPLLWAVETGAVEAAEAILKDLLTIRADRDRYYYGVDDLFERHPDIIRRLCVDSPVLLPMLLDGLIWRSRITERGQRRVVYFLKHLLVKPDGTFAQAIDWITQNQDPAIACHPVVSYVIDLVWTGVAARAFLFRKAWLLMTTIVFMLSQVILNSGLHDGVPGSVWVRLGIFVCRGFIYMVSWPSLAMDHVKRGRHDLRMQNVVSVGCFKLPAHLFEFNSIVSLSLCIILFVMLTLCPILHCLGKPNVEGEDIIFTERCEDGDRYLSTYAFFSMCGMLCYWFLLADLSVFSNRVSAFAIIFGHVTSEVGLFLVGVIFALGAFATAIVALKSDHEGYASIPLGALSLMQVFLGMNSADWSHEIEDHAVVFVPISVFVFLSKIYMVNLLIAQLSCIYSATFLDMLGWARLKRGEVCVASMGSVGAARWQRFLASLRLDEPCEFGEGDVGMPGAVQTAEPAGVNVTTADMIRRFGGSTAPTAAWPEDDEAKADSAEERMERVEGLMKRVLKKLEAPSRRRGAGAGSSASGSGLASSMAASGDSDSTDKSHRRED